MPFDAHDRKDDDMGWLRLRADLLNAPHQTPAFGKFNYTSHVTPPRGDGMSVVARAQSRRISPF